MFTKPSLLFLEKNLKGLRNEIMHLTLSNGVWGGGQAVVGQFILLFSTSPPPQEFLLSYSCPLHLYVLELEREMNHPK